MLSSTRRWATEADEEGVENRSRSKTSISAKIAPMQMNYKQAETIGDSEEVVVIFIITKAQAKSEGGGRDGR